MAYVFFIRLLALCLLALLTVPFSGDTRAEAAAQDDRRDAVILMYHRFGEGRYPSTNIRLDQFDDHLAYLKDNDFSVLPLADIIAAFREGRALPPRTVAITVDDAVASVLTEGWPRMKALGFPLALFVTTEPVEQKLPGYMTWDQIRALEAEGVTIGLHGHTHNSFLDMGVEGTVADIEEASRHFTRELGKVPELLAYPYGEYDAAIARKVEEMGFKTGLAQHSGVASAGGNQFEIPRFALNENYAGMDRFRLIVNARALPVSRIVPSDPRLAENPPAFGFTVASHVRGLSAMSCFPSHLGQAAELTELGDHRLEIRFAKPFPSGRSRINCTMPGPEGRWYWFGRPFFVVD